MCGFLVLARLLSVRPLSLFLRSSSLLPSSSLSTQSSPPMASQYSPPPDDSYESAEPQPHPYLHEPLLYISGLPPYTTDENLAVAFATCAPFRPRIARDDLTQPLSGKIEFKVLDKGLPPLDCHLSDLDTDRRASQRVFCSRESACHTSRAPDPRSITTRPTRAFAISPNHSSHSSSTSQRVSAPRKASPARLYRFPALRPLSSIWRTRFSAHPGRLR